MRFKQVRFADDGYEALSSIHEVAEPKESLAMHATATDYEHTPGYDMVQDVVDDDAAGKIATITTAITQAVMPAVMKSLDKRIDSLMAVMERMEERNCVLEGRINMFEEWAIAEEEGG